MPVFDYECSCGHTEERIESYSVNYVVCPHCGGKAEKIISFTKVSIANQDAAWIRSVRRVVEKDSGKLHSERFLKEPTRTNYHRWMKSEGVRPLEANEKPAKVNEKEAHNKIVKEVYYKHRKRCSISIR